jgi:hypothetical protein
MLIINYYYLFFLATVSERYQNALLITGEKHENKPLQILPDTEREFSR